MSVVRSRPEKVGEMLRVKGERVGAGQSGTRQRNKSVCRFADVVTSRLRGGAICSKECGFVACARSFPGKCTNPSLCFRPLSIRHVRGTTLSALFLIRVVIMRDLFTRGIIKSDICGDILVSGIEA